MSTHSHEIYNNVFVGGDEFYESVKNKPGWSFLRCAKYGPDCHQQLLGYHTRQAPKGPNYLFFRKNEHLAALNLVDIDDPNYFHWDCIKPGLDFIKERLDAGDKIAVCCNSGHSRGPSMGLMFLRSMGDLPYNFHKSEHVYKTLYSLYDPGMGVRQFARSHWSELEGMELANGTEPR
jgi:hypothetical protein